MSKWSALAAQIEATELAWRISMGLTTANLRARYDFWNVMRNAVPSHERWAFHPGITMYNCVGEPWR